MSAADMINPMHPTIANVLKQHLAVANIESMMIYRATCGDKPPFRSENDALAYDKGYRAWPDPHKMGRKGTPMWNGWLDAERNDFLNTDHDQQLGDDWKHDQAMKEREL